MNNVIKTAGIIILENNKVLLVKHGKNAAHINDTYGIPAGRVELNESPIETAIRELLEETGLTTTSENLTKLPKLYTATIERKDGVKEFSLEVFLCSFYSGEIKNNNETSPEWIDINKLDELMLLPNVKNILFDALAQNKIL